MHMIYMCIYKCIGNKDDLKLYLLDQSSPGPAGGRQKPGLAHQRTAHRLFPNINQQHAMQWRQSYTKQTSYN